MKYCPSPDCPYALRHGESQEYREEAVACSDCGASLVSEAPVRATARTPGAETPWVGITLAIVVPAVVAWLGPRVSLPRLDTQALESALGGYVDDLRLSVLALGLNPVVSAALLVELAALTVPRWRGLRTGGPSGRARLQSATGWLALALAMVQGLGIALYLERMGALLPDPRLSRLVVVLSLVGGTFFLVALARFLDVAAVGGGFSLLLTAFALSSLVPLLKGLLERFSEGTPGRAATATLVALLLAAIGSVIVLRRPAGDSRRLPLPACGLVPLQWSASAAALVLLASGHGLELDPTRAIAAGREPWSIALGLLILAALAVACCYLFNRPSKLASFGPDAGARVNRALLPSAAYVVAFAVLGGVVGQQLVLDTVSLLPLAGATAVVLDVVAESATIRRHGPLSPVWPEHRLYAVGPAQAVLERAGIPSLARSAHQRVLWHFFAPFIPIQIMVPRERADEAVRVLEDYFQVPGSATPSSVRNELA